eukprot:TRINITY_DN1850_c0_g1_i1.p1 TRINITY_DN1850_c0_g1~~TRINITY_DN1850_c0_g1_i1.p1  ORF type:complete len:231 (-),score=64.67 TRINITY_DN1850_c0_g1_i1:164-856(-)
MAMDAGDDYTAFVSTVAELEALQRAEESQLRAASAQAAELRATLCEAAAREDRLRGAADGVDMEQVELRRGELRAALLRRGRLRTALREQRRWLSDVHGATAAERAAEAAHRKLRETYMLAHALALPAAHKAALLARRDELGRCKQLKQLRTGTEEFRAWLDQAVAQHEALARELVLLSERKRSPPTGGENEGADTSAAASGGGNRGHATVHRNGGHAARGLCCTCRGEH